ncbi:MAG TPA: flavin reductase family protein [Anaerolineae bacterium]|nr:flavin reductase family protein [Anaerolineae bacterium]
MSLESLSLDDFLVKPMHLWGTQYLLLTSGDFEAGEFNAMTVGWGSFGIMWSRPFVQVVVRPIRYTYGFMEQYDTFTVCAFPPEGAEALQLLGTKSGRDGDKIAEAGLHPIPSKMVAAPGYEEAELILECRKLYWDDMEKANFLDPDLDAKYPRKAYHRIYYGEILLVLAEDHYRA